MSWKIDIDIKDQPVPRVVVEVSIGSLGSPEVLEERLDNEESYLHLKVAVASELASYINTHGLPGMDPISGVEAELILNGAINKNNTKLTLNRPVSEVDFESKEDVYKTGIVTGTTSFGERWALQVTTMSPIDLLKEYPTEVVRIEPLNHLGPPDDAADFSDVTRELKSSILKTLKATIPESAFEVPGYDSSKYNYMGHYVTIFSESDKEVLATGSLTSAIEDLTFSTVDPALILGKLDYDDDVLTTVSEETTIDGIKYSLSILVRVTHAYTYNPNGVNFARKITTGIDSETIYRFQILSGSRISTLIRKINQAGRFHATQILGEPSYVIEGLDISEEPLFELLDSDREDGLHYSSSDTLPAQSTPTNPLPVSDQISSAPPTDYPPGSFDSPSFDSEGLRTS
jgi:hypothetical protein